MREDFFWFTIYIVDSKKFLVVGVVGVAIIVVVALAVVFLKRGAPVAGPAKPAVDQNRQLPGIISTREAAPAEIAVPDAKATGTPANVAIPKTTAPANAANSATFRSFDVSVQGGKFAPDTVIVNQWDTVRISLTAVDAAYDFTQADFGFKLPLPKGEAKMLEFSASGQGDFLFYCTLCGGPDKGPKGHLIVTTPKN